MLDLVRKVSMVGGPTFTGRASVRRREKNSAKRSLVIRPRSLLCSMNEEDYYSNSTYIQRQSNTWKFHRPKSYRYSYYLFFIEHLQLIYFLCNFAFLENSKIVEDLFTDTITKYCVKQNVMYIIISPTCPLPLLSLNSYKSSRLEHILTSFKKIPSFEPVSILIRLFRISFVKNMFLSNLRVNFM